MGRAAAIGLMTLEENRNPFSLVPQSTREVDPFISLQQKHNPTASRRAPATATGMQPASKRSVLPLAAPSLLIIQESWTDLFGTRNHPFGQCGSGANE